MSESSGGKRFGVIDDDQQRVMSGLDSCMGLAVQSMLDRGFAQTTLEFKISFVQPITPQTGQVKAEGKVIACGRRVGSAEGTLTDEHGRVLAHGTTTCLIFEYRA